MTGRQKDESRTFISSINDAVKVSRRGKNEIGLTESEFYWSMENLQGFHSIPSINPINLNYYGKEQCQAGFAFGPFKRTNYVLHMVNSGFGSLKKMGKEFQVIPGQAFLIYPGEETIYQADKTEPWRYMWIGFHGFRSEEFMQRAGFSPEKPVLTLRNMDKICIVMEELLRYSEMNYVNELLRMGALYHLLALITENGSGERPEIREEMTIEQIYVKAAVNFLINAKEGIVRVADVAAAIGISRSYLTSIFKREMKVSPQEFLMNFRMERAADLLRYTDRPVGEIAEEVGYGDSMSFSKAFKKYHHLTPSDFRIMKPELVALKAKGEYEGENSL